MVWLFVLGLLVWCLILTTKLSDLGVRLEALKRELAAPGPAKPAQDRPAAAKSPPAAAAQPAVTAPPLPIAAAVAAAPRTLAPPVPPPPVQPPRPPAPPGPSVADWLSEKGLAWIGGGALALGGLMLVAYAAQRGVFTPALRVAAAGLLGLAAMGAGEGLRRGLVTKGPPPLLVAALVTAAGAATLYAAIWAAFRLYHFIPEGAAAVLLAAVSFSLLALALRHGEALGMLAVVAAYAVPIVTGGGDWDVLAVGGFVFLVLATGMAAAGLRGWGGVGALTLAGGFLWVLARDLFGGPQEAGVSLLSLVQPLLALAAVVVAGRRGAIGADRSGRLLVILPAAAVIGASLLALIQWSHPAPAGPGFAALTTAVAALVVAAGVRLRRLSPGWLAAPVATVVVAAPGADRTMQDVPWLLASLAAIAAAGFDAAQRSEQRRAAAAIAAVGVALALAVAAPGLAAAMRRWDWTADLAFAVLFAAAAVVQARRAADAQTDWTTAAWIAGSTATAGLALHAGLDARVAPTAYGLVALALAALSERLRWRGFAESAVAAGLVSFAGLLGGSVAGAAIAGTANGLVIGGAAAGAALAQSAAWRILKRRDGVAGCVEALSTTAILSGLLGAFLVLQTLGGAHGQAGMIDSAFVRASLRTILLIAAGLLLTLRGAATPLGRWRGPALLVVGALHGLVLQGLILHPWWGLGDRVAGPPLIDGLLLGLLAPALLLAETARRASGRRRAEAALAALLFLVLWMGSEIRRLFHGPVLGSGDLGYAEAAAYAAAALGLALALQLWRARSTAAPAEGVLATAVEAVGWTAVGLGFLLLTWTASPWWGPLAGDLRDPLRLGLIYAAACLAGGGLAYVERRAGRRPLAQAALAAAGVEVFVLITLAIRFGFHGGAMRAPLREASLETWTFSAAWALYGLAALAVGAGRRDMALRGIGLVVLLATTAKVFLFDLGRLEGVLRAASFLALGVVLLVGALAARRFAAPAEPPPAG